MSDQSFNDAPQWANALAVAIARLETKQDAMMKQLDELTRVTDQHWKKIGELETKLAVLESARAPKVHWVVYVTAAVSVLAFVAAFVTWVIK